MSRFSDKDAQKAFRHQLFFAPQPAQKQVHIYGAPHCKTYVPASSLDTPVVSSLPTQSIFGTKT